MGGGDLMPMVAPTETVQRVGWMTYFQDYVRHGDALRQSKEGHIRC